jgi:hypothetical protein
VIVDMGALMRRFTPLLGLLGLGYGDQSFIAGKHLKVKQHEIL